MSLLSSLPILFPSLLLSTSLLPFFPSLFAFLIVLLLHLLLFLISSSSSFFLHQKINSLLVFHISSADPADHFQAMQRPVHLNYRKNGQQIDPLACIPLLIQTHHVKRMSSAIHRLNVDTIRQRQYHLIPYIVQHLAYFQHIVGTRKIFLIGLVN